MSNKQSEITGKELKKGKYYLRVFTDVTDTRTNKWIRRGVDFHISGLMARSLSAVFKKLFAKYPEYRHVDGFKGDYGTPLCGKRYCADINCVVAKWNGEEFEHLAGFTGY